MLLSVKNISKSFGKENNRSEVLKDLSFSLADGESMAIAGPSGSGKTTLLNIIGTLEEPDSGNVFFREKNLTELEEKELNIFRNRSIGFIFQFHHLLPQCTILENVLIPTLTMNSQERKEKARYAGELLKRIGIWSHRDKIPSKLSGGECQRVAVVRAIINRPSLLLADEPTGALDSENAEKIAELLLELNREDGLSILLVTHAEKLALRMNSVNHIVNGKLVKNK